MNKILNFSGKLMGLSTVDKSQESVDIEMVFVEGGTFTIGYTPLEGEDCGDNGIIAHEILLGDYYIGKYEVTQAQWKAIMGEDHNPSCFKGDQLPVENVSWKKVQKFIEKINVKTGKNYRLPTATEWEYAARGGNKSKGYKYSGSNNVDKVGWYDKNSGNKTHPVGTKMGNELEIYDMSGNVWEWCSDWYENNNRQLQLNPPLASSCVYRLARGGSWFSNAERIRVSFRRYYSPSARDNDLGFRLAHDAE